MAYPNAPIREAVFDIRVDKLQLKNVEELLSFKELVKADFPVEKKRQNITGTIQFSQDKPVENKTHSNLTGFVFLSNDNTRQIQVRIDGFTLNILKPYEKWEIHFETFINNWELYNKEFKPNMITRIATRYINTIEIPIPFNTFQDYIQNIPPIPKCLPQKIKTFFSQIQVPCNDGFRNAVITETIEPEINSVLPFILDIDVSQDLNIENSIESLKYNFGEIRKIKNEIFENCITLNTRKLFL